MLKKNLKIIYDVILKIKTLNFASRIFYDVWIFRIVCSKAITTNHNRCRHQQ